MIACGDIIYRAYRQARILGMDAELSDAEAQYGMEILQGVYDGFFASGEFGLLSDVYVSTDSTADEQSRVSRAASEVIPLPQVYGTGTKARAPYELAAIEVVGESRNIWDAGQWVDIDSLDLNSEAALIQFGQSGLSAVLAIEVADSFNAQVGAGTARTASRFMAAMRAKRGTANPRATAVYF